MGEKTVAVAAKSSLEIAGEIAAAIIERRLPPGTKLKEEALARLYLVSRTKIRAALLMLSKDELIEIIPEKGAFVYRLSKQEARDIFAVRRILEAALARDFVAMAGADDYARVDAHLERERQALALGDTHLRSRLLGEFHALLADIVGNQLLKEILSKLTARTSLVAVHRQSHDDATCSSDEHGLFIEAARAGKADLAVEIMLGHLEHVFKALRLDVNEDEVGGDRDLVNALLAA